MPTATFLFCTLIGAILVGLVLISVNYAKGLRGSPRELWLLFGYKFSELAGYKMISLSLVLWLTTDCALGDEGAGGVYTAYSVAISASGVVAGILIDTAGIRRVLLASIGLLLFARFSMVWITQPVLAFLLGLMPMALGYSMVQPLTSVAIKRYTTKIGAAYGFSLFYVLMNLAFAFGNSAYDYATDTFCLRDAAGKNIDQGHGLEIAGVHFSTYRLLFAAAFLTTLFSLFLSIWIREGVERDGDEIKIAPGRRESSPGAAVKKTLIDTWRTLADVAGERFFRVFLGLIALLIFVRSIFVYWDIVLPSYCQRVLGEGAKVGAIANVNTILILFFVPITTILTARMRSYPLMIIGSIISVIGCLIPAIPEGVFEPLTRTTLGEMVFVNWLGLAKDAGDLAAHPPSPFYWSLILSFIVVTVGEALWSPRFYQYTAEIAPKGREATYLSLSVLPSLASKFLVGPTTGLLLSTYTPVDETKHALPHPDHRMIWIWIGIIAAITPIGMLCYRKFFARETERAGIHPSDA